MASGGRPGPGPDQALVTLPFALQLAFGARLSGTVHSRAELLLLTAAARSINNADITSG